MEDAMTQLTKKHYTTVEKITFSACVIVTLVLVYGISQFNSRKMKIKSSESAQINYEMAKLKTADSLYSLENREIELDYKALQAKKAAAAVAAAKAKVAVTDKTKKAAAAKTATAQKQALQKAAQKNKVANNLKSNVTKPMSLDEKETLSKNTLNNSSAHYAGSYSNTVTAPEASPEEVNQRSFEDWKLEIFSAQNNEVILKLTAAYKKGEVSEETFQQLVDDMLNSGDDKMIRLGLYALRANGSYTNYVKLIKAQGQVNSTFSTYIQESLMSYHQNGLGILKQALANPERAIVLKTLEIIKSGVTNIRAGSTTTMIDPRYRRNPSQFSITSYLTFLPVLRDMVNNSGDQEIRTLANQNISIINTQQSVAALN